MELKDKRILITGGSTGIGKATACLLREAGAKVAVTARDEEVLRKSCEETGAHPIPGDVSKPEDVKRVYDTFLSLYGGLDVLINNAGIGAWGGLDELSFDEMDKVFAVNVKGAAMMAQQAAQIFKKQSSGNIINIGSSSALKGYEKGSIYVASKFALRGMTECWRAELRPHNVRVFLINPSEVRTAFFNEGHQEREEVANKLRALEIAHAIKSALEMDDRGFIPELNVWATNPF